MDKTVFHDISYGMYIVSTIYNNKNVGCVANTFTQITSEDMIVSLSINKNNFTNLAIRDNKKFALTIMSEQTNPEIIGKFGFYSSRDVDKFENIPYEKKHDLPIITKDMCGYLICEVINIIETSTHDIFLAKVIDAEKLNNIPAMTYSYYHKVIKGKAPQTAPTYIKELEVSKETKKYQCQICGYIYDEEVDFDSLPNDWKCPICGVPKEHFKQI